MAARLLRLMLLAVLFALLAAADPARADPPLVAGRVAEVTGDVWLFDVDNREWTRLARNQTVSQGDLLRSDPGSRLYMRIGSSSVWLDEQSEMEISQLDDGRSLFRLIRGSLAVRLRSTQAVQETKIQTRDGWVTPQALGLVRASITERGTRVVALAGQFAFESDSARPVQRAWLQGGEQAEFWWMDGPRTERQSLGFDAFANWFAAIERDESALRVSTTQIYVSPEMTGVEVLEAHGRWEQAADYGAIWIPTTVGPGWAPYRDGRWVWSRHWGWSWVDAAPWGFAPFHYGRWVQYRNRWCWAPGRYEIRPVYAPALVTWVGTPRVPPAAGVWVRQPPPVRWVPLGVRETYVPSFAHTPGHALHYNGGFELRAGREAREAKEGRDGRDGRDNRVGRERPDVRTAPVPSGERGPRSDGPSPEGARGRVVGVPPFGPGLVRPSESGRDRRGGVDPLPLQATPSPAVNPAVTQPTPSARPDRPVMAPPVGPPPPFTAITPSQPGRGADFDRAERRERGDRAADARGRGQGNVQFVPPPAPAQLAVPPAATALPAVGGQAPAAPARSFPPAIDRASEKAAEKAAKPIGAEEEARAKRTGNPKLDREREGQR